MNAPELGDLRHHLALLEGRIRQLRRGLKDPGGPAYAEECQAAYRAFEGKLQSGDGAGAAAALAALKKKLEDGIAQETTWGKLLALIEEVRKLVETAARKERELRTSMSPGQVLATARFLAQAVREHVDDPDVLRRIGERFSRLIR